MEQKLFMGTESFGAIGPEKIKPSSPPHKPQDIDELFNTDKAPKQKPEEAKAFVCDSAEAEKEGQQLQGQPPATNLSSRSDGLQKASQEEKSNLNRLSESFGLDNSPQDAQKEAEGEVEDFSGKIDDKVQISNYPEPNNPETKESFSNLSLGNKTLPNMQPQVMGSFGSMPFGAAKPKEALGNGLAMASPSMGKDPLADSNFNIKQKEEDEKQIGAGLLQEAGTLGDIQKRSETQEEQEKEPSLKAEPVNRHHANPRHRSGQKSKENKTKSIGHYLLGKTIGVGTFGKVKLGTHNLTGEKVAVKILEKHKIVEDVDVERVAREIKILKLARHPNIIQLYEIIETPKQLYLVTEYIPGGELFDYIVKHTRLKESEACKFYQQIISGIEYLHELGIVHRDMKPENLLIDHDGRIKLVDFGLSNTYKPGQTLRTACGSPCYAAPEMIAGDAYHGSRVDIWSCGIILFAMVCGFLPFEDPDTNTLYKKILDGRFEIPEWISSDCKDLLNKILNIDPEERVTVNDIMAHPWYRENHKPVIRNFGLIIGKNKIPLEQSIVKMLKQYGFKQDEAEKSLNSNKHNQVTTVYYLLHKRYEKLGKVPCHFVKSGATSGGESKMNEASPEAKVQTPPKVQEEVKTTPEKRKRGIQSMDEKSMGMSPGDKLTPQKGLPGEVSDFKYGSSEKKAKRMDSAKELELSCSPVKRGRRGPLKNDDSPYNHKRPFDDDSEAERKKEEKGSRSPDKKKRRQIGRDGSMSSSGKKKGGLISIQKIDAAPNMIRLNFAGGDSPKKDLFSPEAMSPEMPTLNKKLFDTQAPEAPVLGIGEGLAETPRKNNFLQAAEDAQHHLAQSYSPKILQNGSTAKPKKLLYKNLEDYSAAKEYEKKIEKYKRQSYKYTKGKDRSADDMARTKQLLKNIDFSKILNRRGVFSPGVTAQRGDLLKGPKTTTAAEVGDVQAINLSKQNKRATSIDENAVDPRAHTAQKEPPQPMVDPTGQQQRTFNFTAKAPPKMMKNVPENLAEYVNEKRGIPWCRQQGRQPAMANRHHEMMNTSTKEHPFAKDQLLPAETSNVKQNVSSKEFVRQANLIPQPVPSEYHPATGSMNYRQERPKPHLVNQMYTQKVPSRQMDQHNQLRSDYCYPGAPGGREQPTIKRLLQSSDHKPHSSNSQRPQADRMFQNYPGVGPMGHPMMQGSFQSGFGSHYDTAEMQSTPLRSNLRARHPQARTTGRAQTIRGTSHRMNDFRQMPPSMQLGGTGDYSHQFGHPDPINFTNQYNIYNPIQAIFGGNASMSNPMSGPVTYSQANHPMPMHPFHSSMNGPSPSLSQSMNFSQYGPPYLMDGPSWYPQMGGQMMHSQQFMGANYPQPMGYPPYQFNFYPPQRKESDSESSKIDRASTSAVHPERRSDNGSQVSGATGTNGSKSYSANNDRGFLTQKPTEESRANRQLYNSYVASNVTPSKHIRLQQQQNAMATGHSPLLQEDGIDSKGTESAPLGFGVSLQDLLKQQQQLSIKKPESMGYFSQGGVYPLRGGSHLPPQYSMVPVQEGSPYPMTRPFYPEYPMQQFQQPHPASAANQMLLINSFVSPQSNTPSDFPRQSLDPAVFPQINEDEVLRKSPLDRKSSEGQFEREHSRNQLNTGGSYSSRYEADPQRVLKPKVKNKQIKIAGPALQMAQPVDRPEARKEPLSGSSIPKSAHQGEKKPLLDEQQQFSQFRKRLFEWRSGKKGN